jgi:SAM-dependent methyltransferase
MMDTWLYYEVTHAGHVYCNPISEEGVRDLERVLELRPGVRVLDIACGHAEMLIGFAERHGTIGVGVDASPYALARGRRHAQARVPDADLTLIEGRGEEYAPAAGTAFDVAMCVGASWIWDGFEGTLRALAGFVRPGGLLVSGEPYWKCRPTPEYCAGCEVREEDFGDLHGCYELATRLGLTCVWARRSTDGEWDRYELDQMAAVDRFAREQPDHPDLEAIRRRHERDRSLYLRYGHRELGFALWVFRTPDAGGPPSP